MYTFTLQLYYPKNLPITEAEAAGNGILYGRFKRAHYGEFVTLEAKPQVREKREVIPRLEIDAQHLLNCSDGRCQSCCEWNFPQRSICKGTNKRRRHCLRNCSKAKTKSGAEDDPASGRFKRAPTEEYGMEEEGETEPEFREKRETIPELEVEAEHLLNCSDGSCQSCCEWRFPSRNNCRKNNERRRRCQKRCPQDEAETEVYGYPEHRRFKRALTERLKLAMEGPYAIGEEEEEEEAKGIA